jgi:O-antigen/teichoic acid export membrane protein
MGLFFYFRLLSEPMVTLFYAQRREHLLLVFQSVLTAARLIALVALMRIDAASAILGFSLVSAIGYLVLGHLILHGVGQPALRLTLRTLAITTAACGALAALRMAVLGSWFPSL